MHRAGFKLRLDDKETKVPCELFADEMPCEFFANDLLLLNSTCKTPSNMTGGRPTSVCWLCDRCHQKLSFRHARFTFGMVAGG
jgi:hypothetical protein